MDTLAEKLDTKLRTWKPEMAAEVRERVVEVNEVFSSANSTGGRVWPEWIGKHCADRRVL